MKNFLIIILAAISVYACKSKQTVRLNEQDLLPKDVSLKPKTEYSEQRKDEAGLTKMREEIDYLISKKTCKDASEWRISPIGAKACGGPASYVAYPIKSENEILEKIKNYTKAQDNYNKKYGIVSDCAMVMPPSGIVCRNGKAVLISAGVK